MDNIKPILSKPHGLVHFLFTAAKVDFSPLIQHWRDNHWSQKDAAWNGAVTDADLAYIHDFAMPQKVYISDATVMVGDIGDLEERYGSRFGAILRKAESLYDKELWQPHLANLEAARDCIHNFFNVKRGDIIEAARKFYEAGPLKNPIRLGLSPTPGKIGGHCMRDTIIVTVGGSNTTDNQRFYDMIMHETCHWLSHRGRHTKKMEEALMAEELPPEAKVASMYLEESQATAWAQGVTCIMTGDQPTEGIWYGSNNLLDDDGNPDKSYMSRLTISEFAKSLTPLIAEERMTPEAAATAFAEKMPGAHKNPKIMFMKQLTFFKGYDQQDSDKDVAHWLTAWEEIVGYGGNGIINSLQDLLTWPITVKNTPCPAFVLLPDKEQRDWFIDNAGLAHRFKRLAPTVSVWRDTPDSMPVYCIIGNNADDYRKALKTVMAEPDLMRRKDQVKGQGQYSSLRQQRG